jgi:thiol-disulfide isomerase/thioredoxin
MSAYRAIVSIIFLALSISPGQAKKPPSLPFSHDLDGTLARAEESGKPVMVTFVAAWCPLCTKMKRDVFTDPALLALEDSYLWVMVDIDRNLTTAQTYAVDAVPTTYLMDSAGDVQRSIVGLQRAEELRAELEGFLESIATPPAQAAPAEVDAGIADRPRSGLVWKPQGYRGVGICFSHVGYGPLRIDSQSPFQSLRLGIRPRTPSTLGKGQSQVRGTGTWVNIWANSQDANGTDEYFLDFEMLSLNAAYAYGITDTLEVEAEFQSRSRFGGVMDGFIQGFHDLFSIDQAGRDLVPKNDFSFDLNPPGGAPSVSLSDGDRGTFAQGLLLSLQHNVTCGTAKLPAFSYSVGARLDTVGDGDLSGDSDWDFGVSVALARRFKRLYVYGTLGYAWFGQDNFRGLELRDSQWTFLAALEWRYRARQSFLAQVLISEGVVANFDPFSATSNEITLGWKWEAIDRGIFEAGLIENLATFDNSPDFGFHVGWTQRF